MEPSELSETKTCPLLQFEKELCEWTSLSSLPEWITEHSNYKDIELRHDIKIDIIQYILTKNEKKQTEKEKQIIIKYLQNTSFFKDFHFEILKDLIPFIKCIRVGENNHKTDVIYSQSDSVQNIYVVRQGQIELRSVSKRRDPQPIMYGGNVHISEHFEFSDEFGVQRIRIQNIHKGMSFGSDELPHDFLSFLENNININEFEGIREWTAIAKHSNKPIKLLSIKINDIIETFHKIQLQKTNSIYEWLIANALFKSHLSPPLIDKLFECTTLKTRKYNQIICRQDSRINHVIFVIDGRVQIEKTLICDNHKMANIRFTIDAIDEFCSPFIGTEIVLKHKTYQYTTRALSKRVEYLVLSVDKLYLLFRSQPIRQWFFNRCIELRNLLYRETQTFYENHLISTNCIGFPRCFSHRKLYTLNQTSQKRILIPNHSVCNILPKKKAGMNSKRRRSLKRCSSVGTIKRGKQLIHEIVHNVQLRNDCQKLPQYNIDEIVAY